ncbi:MAG: hypothetical protein AB7F86_00090 [Bdellovibrionales bacterium]
MKGVTFWLAALSFWAWAGKTSYPPQKFLAKGVKKIEIIGVRGQVNLRGNSSKAYSLKVRHTRSRRMDDWSLQVFRRGSTMVFEVFNIAQRGKWRRMVRKDQWPEFDIELRGPAVPTVVSWREGDLKIENWAGDLESTQVSGTLKIDRMTGQLEAHAGRASVEVTRSSGDFRIEGERGRMKLDDFNGALKLVWLNGDLNLSKIRGHGSIQGEEGRLQIVGCSGKWQLKWDRGQVRVNDCAGQLAGVGQAANWSLVGKRAIETEIRSRSGPVQIRWQGPGARVFLTSDKGTIRGRPWSLDAKGRRISDSRLKGAPTGEIFVQTETGAIVFNQ